MAEGGRSRENLLGEGLERQCPLCPKAYQRSRGVKVHLTISNVTIQTMLLLFPEFQSHLHEDAIIATRDIKTQGSMKEPVQKTPCQQEL